MDSSPQIAIVVLGILLATTLGIVCSVLFQLLWFLFFIPLFGLLLLFLFILSFKQTRNLFLHKHILMTYIFILTVSSIGASLLFIIFSLSELLPGLNEIYCNMGTNYKELTHPFDSLKSIWGAPFIFLCETPISLLFFWIGKGLHAVRKRIGQKRSLNHA